MEDNCDLEVIRLKRLLEDRLIQVEKENMELIKNGYSDHCVQFKNIQTHTVKLEISSTPFFPTSNQRASNSCTKHSQLAKANIRSCPHLKMHQSKKYSNSEIRIDNPHSNIHFLNHLESSLQVDNLKRRVLQNEGKSKYIPCAVPLSPPIRIKKEEIMSNSVQSHPELLADSRISYSILPLPQKKKLVIQKLPDITIKDENIDKISSKEGKKNEKASQIFLPVKRDFPQIFNADAKSRFRSSEASSNSKILECSFSSEISPKHSKSLPVPNSNSNNIPQGTNENHGFNLQISLDSYSTKDLVSKILQKIPEFINENQATDSGPNKNVEETQAYKTQNIINLPKDFVDQTLIVSTSVQTEPIMEQSVNQHVLHDLVKGIVLDTIKDAHISRPISSVMETLPLYHKIDSDIQSEEHNIADSGKISKTENSKKYMLLNEENNLQHKNLLSKSVQVSLNLDQAAKKQPVCNENIKLENSHLSVETFNSNLINEEINTSLDKFQKVELMLEKIYENVCKGTGVPNSDIGISPDHPILTREVAVQFNPLQTSTKSIMTSEIKTVDSCCQCDIQSNTNCAFKSYADTSVQTINCANYCKTCQTLQVNAYTQSEKKKTFDVDVQTEIFGFEHSATNTSVSSTPVSDSMFMDDLLSEGEMPLPWNLRLISLSDKGGAVNINNTDSSDVSIKDKDYSLSEGEIHPNIIHYLNAYQRNSGENDRQHDISVSSLVSDPSVQNVSKNDSEIYASHHLVYNQNSQNQQFGSSLSEGELNYNESLSFGEVSPQYKVSS